MSFTARQTIGLPAPWRPMWSWLLVLLYPASLWAVDVRVVYLTSPCHFSGPYDPPGCAVAAQLAAADVNADPTLLGGDNLIVDVVGATEG